MLRTGYKHSLRGLATRATPSVGKPATETLFKDYPRPLFWHRDATSHHLSFLPEIKRPASWSSLVIGHTDSAPISGHASFTSSAPFEALLRRVLAENIANDPSIQAMGAYQRLGFVHVIDERVAAMPGRVPDPNDLFGHVLLAPIVGEQASGSALFTPNSFQPNDMHRLCTADGLFRLSPFMQDCLMRALHHLNEQS